MSFVFGLLLGLLIGWIVELIIDWRFWRLDADSISSRFGGSSGNGDASALRAELAEAKAEISRLKAATGSATAATSTAAAGSGAEDPLERIRGIGKVFKSRFNEAGIYTFAEVAALTPDQITNILGVTDSWRNIDPEAWIAEAAQLANEKNG